MWVFLSQIYEEKIRTERMGFIFGPFFSYPVFDLCVSAALFSYTTIVQLNDNTLLHLQIVLQRNSYFFSLSNTHTHIHICIYSACF